MAGTTIASGQTAGVRLTARSQNPLTVTGAGSVITAGAYAIYGAPGYDWTVGNAGTISAPSGNAIQFAGAGNVGNAGLITGGLAGGGIFGALVDGVYMGSGSVTNSSGATITADGAGVSIVGAGTVANLGSIASGSAEGVRIGSGGIYNAVGATITGDRTGAIVYGAGTVVNQGRIIERSGAAAAYVRSGGISNASGATITGADSGVIIYNTGTVANQGAIIGDSQVGVYFGYGGGLLSNAAGATITGDRTGVTFRGSGTVVNQGRIVARSGVIAGYVRSGGDGIDLQSGGMVSNASGGTIVGGIDGIYFNGVDYGIHGHGVNLSSGGTVSNAGLIVGYDDGVRITGGVGTVSNAAGAIISGGRYAVYMTDGGTVTNAGVMVPRSNSFGVYIRNLSGQGNGSTLINFGTIAGRTFYDVLNDPRGNLVVDEPGAVFEGGVMVLSGGTLELASANATGTLSNFGFDFRYFNLLTVDPGARWDLTGVNQLEQGATLTATGATLTNDGLLAFPLASSGETDILVNNGTIVLDASSLTVAGLTGGGSATINAGGTLAVQGAIDAGETIDFADAGGLIRLAAPDTTAGRIDGFTPGDTIDLTTVQFGDVGAVAIGPGNTLSVEVIGGTTLDLLLDPTQNFTGLTVGAVADGGGGTSIVLTGTPPCFRAGTRIRTERGNVPVERLREGDRVATAPGGATEPVIWIGHRTIDCTRHPQPRQVWPVCIAAGAFGSRRPGRDLWLSPDHAVFFDGALIPVKYLINASSVVQTPIAAVIYYHVELPRHAVLFAEGLPAESYLDTGDRTNFANGNGPMRLFPDFASLPRDVLALWEAKGCAPLRIVGPTVQAVRQLLEDRAVAAAKLVRDHAPRRRAR